MNNKVIQYRYPCLLEQEAKQCASTLRKLEGCIDASFDIANVVISYHEVDDDVRRKQLPEGCKLVPTPLFKPGEQVYRVQSYGHFAHRYPCTVVHIAYIAGRGYRYQVLDQGQKERWCDPDQLVRSVEEHAQ